MDSEAINVRFPREQIDLIDGWIAEQGPPFVTRPEAIRRLVEKGLDSE